MLLDCYRDLIQDVRYAARGLRNNWVFTLVAVSILAIGIGATSAIFTQVNAVLWNPVRVQQPAQLRTVRWISPTLKTPVTRFSLNAYRALRDHTHLSDLACTSAVGSRNFMADWGPVTFQVVTGNYFRLLGVDAILGRTITPEDDRAGNPAAIAVIGYRLWRRAYGGDASVLGRTITISKVPFQIVGVLPEGFAGLDPTTPREVMMPYSSRAWFGTVTPADENAWTACSEIAGRLPADVSDEQVRAEAQVLMNDLMAANLPRDGKDARVVVTSLDESVGQVALRKSASPPLFLLMAAAGVILLIACANIGGLLLARGRARQKELATRLAIGAPRLRIVRLLITESLLLSLAGGAAGIALAYAAVPLLPDLLSELSGRDWLNPAQTVGVSLKPDLRVMAFSLVLTFATGLIFGLLPAIRTSRLDLVSMMKQTSGAAMAGRFQFRTGKALVALQVALSMLALVGAGLFIRTLLNLMAVPVGYTPDGLMFVTLDPSRTRPGFIEDTLRTLEASPGVNSAAVSQWPIYNNAEPKLPVCVASAAVAENGMDLEPVTPHFFATWGVRLLAGREFETGDVGRSAIVNNTFARTFFPNVDPIGQVVGIGKCPGSARTIVGVVADHVDRQRVKITPMVYLAYPFPRQTSPSTFALRTSGDSPAMILTVRRMMSEAGAILDGDVMTGAAYQEREWRKERLLAGSFIFFGVQALLISCLGIYGLLTYTVNWRTSEIGIRMALGAYGGTVSRMVIAESLLPVVAGVAGGLIAALALTRWVAAFLFGVSEHDPSTIAAAIVLFLLTAALAAWLPARRASLIDPVRALRSW